MNNAPNPYYQPQGMPPIPPQGMLVPPAPVRVMPRPRTWKERVMSRYGMGMYSTVQKGALTIPDWITGKSVAFFFVAMFACPAVFGYVPKLELLLVSVLSVILFFYGGAAMSRSWAHTSEKVFVKNVFVAGVVIRLLWAGYCYFFFNPEFHGNNYGETADVDWYMPFAKDLAQWLRGDSPYTFSQIVAINGSAIDDIGYPTWLAVGYFIWGDISDVFMPFVVKCIVSAYCATSIYRIAKRHFGEGTARMAAIFVCVNPNMIYWCGNMFKEAEMVFLCCVAVDNFDRVLTSGKRFTFKNLLPGMLAGLALMFFRTALGLVVFLAVFAHIVMASNRVLSMGKKILAGILVGSVLLVSMGDRIRTQSQNLIERAQSGDVQKEIEWRGNVKNEQGRNQSFAKYATATVFAPLIFTIPFPTFNQAHEGQLLQVQLSGGSYIKNIFSFFVIIVMFLLLISGDWRQHVFILAYTLGYLMVLVLSPFAQSGRFHMPIWPMLMLFAAYGVQIAKGNARMKRGFTIVLVLEVVACLAWNWFKLRGRGMI